MSRITGFINTTVGNCLSEVSKLLDEYEKQVHRMGMDKQADEDDKKAYSDALVRIQKIRNGLHGG